MNIDEQKNSGQQRTLRRLDCQHIGTTGPNGRWRCSDCGKTLSEREEKPKAKPEPKKAPPCENCGGWGGGAWNGNDSPFENYLPCYKCGL